MKLSQEVFEGKPPDLIVACVDYDGTLKFGNNIANLRYTWASEVWRGAEFTDYVQDSGYDPLTMLIREGMYDIVISTGESNEV